MNLNIFKWPINYSYVPLDSKKVKKSTVTTYWSCLFLIIIAISIYYALYENKVTISNINLVKGNEKFGTCATVKSGGKLQTNDIIVKDNMNISMNLYMWYNCSSIIVFEKLVSFPICTEPIKEHYDADTNSLISVSCTRESSTVFNSLYDMIGNINIEPSFFDCYNPEKLYSIVLNYRFTQFNGYYLYFHIFSVQIEEVGGECISVSNVLYNLRSMMIINNNYFTCPSSKFIENIQTRVLIDDERLNKIANESDYQCTQTEIRYFKPNLGSIFGLFMFMTGIIPIISKLVAKHKNNDDNDDDILLDSSNNKNIYNKSVEREIFVEMDKNNVGNSNA